MNSNRHFDSLYIFLTKTMAQQSILKASVKSIINSFSLSKIFSSLFLSFHTALEPSPTQEPIKNYVLAKKVLNKILEYHYTYRLKNK